jgi:hypothetical protein
MPDKRVNRIIMRQCVRLWLRRCAPHQLLPLDKFEPQRQSQSQYALGSEVEMLRHYPPRDPVSPHLVQDLVRQHLVQGLDSLQRLRDLDSLRLLRDLVSQHRVDRGLRIGNRQLPQVMVPLQTCVKGPQMLADLANQRSVRANERQRPNQRDDLGNPLRQSDLVSEPQRDGPRAALQNRHPLVEPLPICAEVTLENPQGDPKRDPLRQPDPRADRRRRQGRRPDRLRQPDPSPDPLRRPDRLQRLGLRVGLLQHQDRRVDPLHRRDRKVDRLQRLGPKTDPRRSTELHRRLVQSVTRTPESRAKALVLELQGKRGQARQSGLSFCVRSLLKLWLLVPEAVLLGLTLLCPSGACLDGHMGIGHFRYCRADRYDGPVDETRVPAIRSGESRKSHRAGDAIPLEVHIRRPAKYLPRRPTVHGPERQKFATTRPSQHPILAYPRMQ